MNGRIVQGKARADIIQKNACVQQVIDLRHDFRYFANAALTHGASIAEKLLGESALPIGTVLMF